MSLADARRVGGVVVAAAALIAGAGAATAAPAQHISIPAADFLVIRCQDGVTYTGVSGDVELAGGAGASASGNSRFGGTGTLRDVEVTDGSLTYRAVGAWRFGGEAKQRTGSESDRGMFHIQIMGDRGIVATVRITSRLLDDGSLWINDHGTCSQPE